jgi:hypothetical protein
MKFPFSAILAASLTASLVVAAKPHGNEDERKLEEEMHAAAFGAVVTEHSASDWKKFLSEGPLPPRVQVDPLAGHAEQKEKTAGRDLLLGSSNEIWKPDPPAVGYHAIDTEEYGGAMEVKNKSTEQCIFMDEGIGKDGWRFGITKGEGGRSH